MQKIWKKTKNNFTVGINKMDEKVSKNGQNESAEYMKLHDKLKNNEEMINNLTHAILNTKASFKKLGNDVKDTTTSFEKSFIVKGQCQNSDAEKARKVADEISTVTTRLSENMIPTQIITPLSILSEKVKSTKALKEKRRKNRILLQQEEGRLKDARAKSKDVAIHEDSYNKRKGKFEKLDGEFTNAVHELNKERKATFTKVFNAYQFYLMELTTITMQKLQDEFESFPMEECMATFPSLQPKQES